MVRAKGTERCGACQTERPRLGGWNQAPMGTSNEGERDANVAFWQRQFAKFIYAATEAEAVSALTDALRSDAAMPDIFRLALADMLEGGGSVRLSEESWTVRAVRRRDAAQTKARIAVWEQYKEVQELIYQGKSKTAACREVANRDGKLKTQRAVEIAYNECAELLSRLNEEPKRRAEAAMQRSKALREKLRSTGELEDDPSS
jgi:hypothetical protein